MSDEKILTIQEKIQAEKEKVQNRVLNTNISKKNEEKVVETPKKKSIQNPVNRKEEKQSDIADRYYSQPVAKRYCDDGDSDYSYSHHGGSASSILGGIFIMIVGFATLTLGGYIVTSISGSLATSTNDATLINNTGQVISYVNDIFPMFGLAGMVLGFSIILFALRGSIDRGY